MKGKKILLILLLAMVVAATTACVSGGKELCNEDGEMWQYHGAELTPGIYVKHSDIYNPLLAYGLTFSDVKDEYTEHRVVWLYNYRELIPVYNNTDSLLIQYSPEAYPTQPIIMEHFTSQGYSLGALFEKDGTELRFPDVANDICPNSSMQNAMRAEVKSAENTRITELNGDSFPLQLVNQAGYIMGLKQNGLYKIGFYEGTRFRAFVANADTEIFLQDAAYTLTERETTKEGYFIVKMLPEMPNGLYCVNGKQLVYYAGSTYNAVPTPTPEPSEEPTPEPVQIVDTIDTTPGTVTESTPYVVIMQEVK